MRPRKSVNVASLVGSPEDEPSRPNVRLRVVGVVVLVLFLVLVLRLWSLQIIDGKSYAAAVTRNQVRVVSVAAPRGEIVDRNDTVLVTIVPEQELLLSRMTAIDDPSIIGKVAALIGQTPAQVEQSVKNDRYSPYEPVPVATNVSAGTVQFLQMHQAEFPGVSVQTITQRTYPQGGTTATHVLGYLGDITSQELTDPKAGYTQGSLVGQSGIEEQYEAYLRGVNGSQALSVNAAGTVVGTLSRQAPQIGDTVVLNIDTGLQQAVQNDLQAQILLDRKTPDVDDHNKLPPAINGAAIVLNPNNGQVLAMASSPPTTSTSGWEDLQRRLLGAGRQRGREQQRHPGRVHPRLDLQADHRHGGPAGRGVQPGPVLRRHGDVHRQAVQRRRRRLHLQRRPGRRRRRSEPPPRPRHLQRLVLLQPRRAVLERSGTYGNDAIQNVAAEYGEGENTGIDLPDEGRGASTASPNASSCTPKTPRRTPTPPGTPATTSRWRSARDRPHSHRSSRRWPMPPSPTGGRAYAPEVASEIVDPTTGKVVKTIAPVVTGHVNLPAAVRDPILQGLEEVISNPKGTAYSDFAGFPANWDLAGKTGTATNPGDTSPTVVRGLRAQPQSAVRGPGRDRPGWYGAEAAAPLVRNIFDYLVTNPVAAVKTPTAATPPTSALPATTCRSARPRPPPRSRAPPPDRPDHYDDAAGGLRVP